MEKEYDDDFYDFGFLSDRGYVWNKEESYWTCSGDHVQPDEIEILWRLAGNEPINGLDG